MQEPHLVGGTSSVPWEMLKTRINSEKLFHTLSYAFLISILTATTLNIFVLSENIIIISVYLDLWPH